MSSGESQHKTFNRLYIKNDETGFDKFEDEISKDNVNKKSLCQDVILYMYNKAVKSNRRNHENDYDETLADSSENNINSAGLVEVINKAIKNFDPEKGISLRHYINYLLNCNALQIRQKDAFYDPKSSEAKRIVMLTKAMDKCGVDYRDIANLSNEQREALCANIKVDNRGLDILLRELQKKNKSPLVYLNEDDDEEYEICIADKSAGISILQAEVLKMFSYIFKNSKEKKHRIFLMLDSNIVRKMEWSINSFKEYTDKAYTEYANKYREYKSKDIICYEWFDGKREVGSDFDIKDYNNKKSILTQTYSNPYKELCDAYGIRE